MKLFDPEDPKDRVKSIIHYVTLCIIAIIVTWFVMWLFTQVVFISIKVGIAEDFLEKYGLILSDSIW